MIFKTSSDWHKSYAIFSGVVFFLLFLGSCQKEITERESLNSSPVKNDQTDNSLFQPNSGSTQTTVCFSAIAQISACAGELIRFSGEITLRQNTTVDQNGNTHITRSFVVNNLTGVGVTVGSSLSAMTCSGTLLNGSLTGTSYNVSGGAEMFNIHFGAGGSATVGGSNTFVHRGTLVFVENITGRHIVAMHIIRKVNGIIQENRWECQGN